MTQSFLIADQLIRVTDEGLPRLLAGFECQTEGTTAPELQSQEPICSVYHTFGEFTHGVESMTPSHPVAHVLGLARDREGVLMADDRFENLTLRCPRLEGLFELMLTGVVSRLAYYRTVFVHGALIDVPNVGGVLFVGRSGVGKTTQAELWEKLEGAEILNGDKVFLSLRPECPDVVMAYGNPWKGNSPYRVNRRVPVRAVVDLVREDEKYIRPLCGMEALSSLMTAVFMPAWDDRLTGLVMETLDGMFEKLPVYRMSCEPDRSGVDMVARVALESWRDRHG